MKNKTHVSTDDNSCFPNGLCLAQLSLWYLFLLFVMSLALNFGTKVRHSSVQHMPKYLWFWSNMKLCLWTILVFSGQKGRVQFCLSINTHNHSLRDSVVISAEHQGETDR